jgi:hypothetical protein
VLRQRRAIEVRPLVPFLILAAASGCGQEPEKGRKQTAAEVAEEMASLKMEPGQWEATNEILSATAPGLPEGALKQMVGQKSTISNCVTPEQAERPSANFIAAQKNMDCTYQDFSMRGGRIEGTMSCRGQGMPGEMVMRLGGTYEPERYDINMKMDSGAMGASVTIEARTTGRRLGECTGGGQ